jgi:hypothetical protein
MMPVGLIALLAWAARNCRGVITRSKYVHYGRRPKKLGGFFAYVDVRSVWHLSNLALGRVIRESCRTREKWLNFKDRATLFIRVAPEPLLPRSWKIASLGCEHCAPNNYRVESTARKNSAPFNHCVPTY